MNVYGLSGWRRYSSVQRGGHENPSSPHLAMHLEDVEVGQSVSHHRHHHHHCVWHGAASGRNMEKQQYWILTTQQRAKILCGKDGGSNCSIFPGQFRFQFHRTPNCGHGSYYTKHPDRWKWASFTSRTQYFKITILAPIT